MKLSNPSAVLVARLKAGLFLACLIPLAALIARAFAGELGANPIEKLERTLGYWTLSFLLITLAVTPLRRLLAWTWLVRLRRMLGLFAFFYALLHFSTYLIFDQFFDWQGIVKDVAKRPYITVGFSVLVLLIPLAVTSTEGMMRRLGGRRWRQLHRLVYLAAVGGVVHYWWLVKKDISDPALFASLLTVLLGYRLIHAARGRIAERAIRNGPTVHHLPLGAEDS